MTSTYDRFAGAYDRVMRPLERRFLARLRANAFAEMPAGALTLEVGAGTGANFALYPSGARVAATEPSEAMLKEALRKERPSGMRLARCRAERLPFADGAFDAALATLVFCSVESPALALREVRRVVRPGGRVVLLEHVRPEGLLGFVFDALNVLTVALFDDHFNRRTADDARRAGLEVERVEQHLRGIFQLIICRVQ